MQHLTPEGQRIVDELAQRHGMSSDAVLTLLMAVAAGYGTQAQFNHPELGGMGQWSLGGMIMIGDMFNNGLKARVDALASELSRILQNAEIFAATRPAQLQSQSQSGGASGVSLFVPGTFSSGNWWPEALGNPSSTGAQNNLRYAFFPATRRLAIDIGGRLVIYDTGSHQISGVSQQQSADQSLSFTSQHGLIRLADLPVVGAEVNAPRAEERPTWPSVDVPVNDVAAPVSQASYSSDDDILGKIERLASLRDKGILTEAEFAAKKSELLSRL